MTMPRPSFISPVDIVRSFHVAFALANQQANQEAIDTNNEREEKRLA